MGNLLIIITIKAIQTLGTPIYFLLTYLSFTDTCYTSCMAPKMIIDLLQERKTIFFSGCTSQLFAGHLFTSAEIILLVAMASDRYMAICKPLHYTAIMSQHVCGLLMLLKLASTSTQVCRLLVVANSAVMCTLNFLLLVLSYVVIWTLYKLPVFMSVAIFYTTITTMLNPVIDTMRDAEVKSVMRKLWSRKVK
ncbi:olfactory receptor 140-like [Tachyglossus aculeatus]|uniref:olfactory receptor 140-like n=1 Tax=Tachyglossus aculeatus TaxID=9261 RepID=UPI0018F41661|nr:olfactory receptor 140-like [Tachyglossus aculeatus]